MTRESSWKFWEYSTQNNHTREFKNLWSICKTKLIRLTKSTNYKISERKCASSHELVKSKILSLVCLCYPYFPRVTAYSLCNTRRMHDCPSSPSFLPISFIASFTYWVHSLVSPSKSPPMAYFFTNNLRDSLIASAHFKKWNASRAKWFNLTNSL